MRMPRVVYIGRVSIHRDTTAPRSLSTGIAAEASVTSGGLKGLTALFTFSLARLPPGFEEGLQGGEDFLGHGVSFLSEVGACFSDGDLPELLSMIGPG